MGKTTIGLTKICSNCGQQKPLSAFLQLSESEGTTYGHICSSCRKTLSEKTIKPKDQEESTTSTTQEVLDNKSKVKTESDKRKLRKALEDTYFAEREKKETEATIDIEKTEEKAQLEKKHREEKKRSFFERTKQSFSTFLEKPKPVSAPSASSAPSTAAPQTEGKKATAPSVAPNTPVINPRVPGVNTQSPIYNTFVHWLPRSSAFADAAEKTAKLTGNQNGNEPEVSDLNELEDYVRNNSPRSKK